mgnify:CR=1 FL=1
MMDEKALETLKQLEKEKAEKKKQEEQAKLRQLQVSFHCLLIWTNEWIHVCLCTDICMDVCLETFI